VSLLTDSRTVPTSGSPGSRTPVQLLLPRSWLVAPSTPRWPASVLEAPSAVTAPRGDRLACQGARHRVTWLAGGCRCGSCSWPLVSRGGGPGGAALVFWYRYSTCGSGCQGVSRGNFSDSFLASNIGVATRISEGPKAKLCGAGTRMVCDLEAQVGEVGGGDGGHSRGRWRGQVARAGWSGIEGTQGQETRLLRATAGCGAVGEDWRWGNRAVGKGLRPYPLPVPPNSLPLPPCHNFARPGAAFVLIPRYRMPLPAAGTGVGYPSTTGTG